VTTGPVNARDEKKEGELQNLVREKNQPILPEGEVSLDAFYSNFFDLTCPDHGPTPAVVRREACL
jgi:hypothetical protein